MSEIDRRFHETWLGMVQPVDGLVVSIPVLIDAQCMSRQTPETQQRLLQLCPPTRAGEAGPEGFTIENVETFLRELLGFSAFDSGEELPEALSLYVPEGRQTLRPSLGLRKEGTGAAYEMLVWEIPTGLDLDKPESQTGSWDYPPSAKFDRLLRHCRVPIGLLTNREVVRLVYAPHGESSGAITFRLDDMASVGGRPILDAFVMLLSANRFFGVSEDRALPALLAESRKRQANVTNELADQVFEALQLLLRGFSSAAERDGRDLLDDALAREGNHLYQGLLTVLLRLVFVLYSEDRGLLPIEHPLYAANFSLLGLFDQLQSDQGAYPDSMSRRFGAWGRIVSLFRAVFLGLSHGDLKMPARRGSLFDPHVYPFLEGWGPAGSAPIAQAEDRAAVKVPSLDDETVFRVLEKLILLNGQRLSYRALDVEQIGAVYEALMGYHVQRMPSDAVCMKPDRVWLTAEEASSVPAAQRAKWLKEAIGLSKADAEKLAAAVKDVDEAGIVEALSKFAIGGKKSAFSKAGPGQLVLQPGAERRRTSSHYTPRSLSAPIVQRTLEPLLACMGKEPASHRIVQLKVCDAAMGSGAFLVEACRFLGDQLVAAWTREGEIERIAKEHGDPLLYARRWIAQRCLYGVDKNGPAVELAKLSLWLLTLSRDLPFTFVDHSLRHGDSLVGLDFDQIRAFHWKPKTGKGEQLDLFARELSASLDEAVAIRQALEELADDEGDPRERERLAWDAQDALDRVRLIGDVVVGAFFAHEKDKAREEERVRRLGMVTRWLSAGGPAPDELLEMQREIRARLPVFHWMVEFPEVFYAERPDPLDENAVNRAAYMDAFLGNPPFAGKNGITETNGDRYLPWLLAMHDGAHGNADLSAHFFRRTAQLVGEHGTIGLIATNTIAQGDTRATGLQYLVEHGAVIYDAIESMMWPGDAAVSVSVVHLALGNAIGAVGPRMLNGAIANTINSQLSTRSEQIDPLKLASNAQLSFQGSVVLGMGFTLTPDERADLVAKDARNAERTFPYLGGQEVNTSPTQSFDRYVINFGQMTLEEAERWPDLLQIVREEVKPERDKNNRDNYREKWWQFGEARPGLHAAIAPLTRCLVTARVTKHLCFSFQPIDRVLNERLYVFPFETLTPFATLQSRAHEGWTRLHSSTLEDRLNYSASDCFETFPFPTPDPRAAIPALEDIGKRLYEFRAQYMIDENVGITVTYNRLKDAACVDARIVALRALHEEMDRAVIAAYAEGDPDGRWDEVVVAPFCAMNDADKAAVGVFEDAVIDRLFALNALRAAAEKAEAGIATKKPQEKKVKQADRVDQPVLPKTEGDRTQ